MKGRIHSIETFATLEGDGIRFGVFMSGCPLRCAYCHNPDTWAAEGDEYEASELLERAERYRSYYIDGGGVTFTGGEPLYQPKYLAEALKLFKNGGYHTAIDTSGGIIPENLSEIIELTDLFIIDIKFYRESDYNEYCGGKLKNVLELLKRVTALSKEIRLRTVIVPGINDTKIDINEYFKLVKPFKFTEYKLQGYHTMGVYKYRELGIPYRLDNTPDMDEKRLNELRDYLDGLIKNSGT